MNDGMIYARCLTATHFGSLRGNGSIDLPIARAADTDLPIGPDSAVRGALRNATLPPPGDSRLDTTHSHIFGPSFNDDDTAKTGVRGMLTIDDLRLLAMPVRSRAGVVIWATDWLTLATYRAEACNGATLLPPAMPDAKLDAMRSDPKCLAGPEVTTDCCNKKLVFPLDVSFEQDATQEGLRSAWVAHIAEKFGFSDDLTTHFAPRFAIFPSGAMNYFTKFGTEQRPRIRRNDDGTVQDKAFWCEEYLPRESLFFGTCGDCCRLHAPSAKEQRLARQIFLTPKRLVLHRAIFISSNSGSLFRAKFRKVIHCPAWEDREARRKMSPQVIRKAKFLSNVRRPRRPKRLLRFILLKRNV